MVCGGSQGSAWLRDSMLVVLGINAELHMCFLSNFVSSVTFFSTLNPFVCRSLSVLWYAMKRHEPTQEGNRAPGQLCTTCDLRPLWLIQRAGDPPSWPCSSAHCRTEARIASPIFTLRHTALVAENFGLEFSSNSISLQQDKIHLSNKFSRLYHPQSMVLRNTDLP